MPSSFRNGEVSCAAQQGADRTQHCRALAHFFCMMNRQYRRWTAGGLMKRYFAAAGRKRGSEAEQEFYEMLLYQMTNKPGHLNEFNREARVLNGWNRPHPAGTPDAKNNKSWINRCRLENQDWFIPEARRTWSDSSLDRQTLEMGLYDFRCAGWRRRI